MKAVNVISFVLGIITAIVIDVVVFGGIAAIPLAALVYLGIISQGHAVVAIGLVAVLAATGVVLRGKDVIS